MNNLDKIGIGNQEIFYHQISYRDPQKLKKINWFYRQIVKNPALPPPPPPLLTWR